MRSTQMKLRKSIQRNRRKTRVQLRHRGVVGKSFRKEGDDNNNICGVSSEN